MKRVIFFFILTLFSLEVFPQLQFKGKVTDSDGNPLAGANIAILNSYLGTTTDFNGNFKINDLKRRKYKIRVSYMGYKPKTTLISIEEDSELSFSLERKDVLADEVIVSATRASDKAPVARTTVEKTEIESRNVGHDIPYILSLTPSLVSTSEAGIGIGYTNFRIRGTDATRINVTVNGIPLNDAESQGVFWVNMPDFAGSVNNVQIQRGVGTSTNGAAAFGATVNLQTLHLKKNPYAEASIFGGSFNTMKNSVKVGSGLINEKFSFDARLSNVQTDGYIDHSFSDHKSFFVSASYYTRKSLVKANIFSGKERTGISWWGVPDYMINVNRTYNPAGEYTNFEGETKNYEGQTDNYLQMHYQLLFSHEFNRKLTMNAALHYTRGDGYYEQYKDDDEFAGYGLKPLMIGDTVLTTGEIQMVFPDSTIRQSDIIRRKMMGNDFYGFTYSLNYKYKKIDASIGGAWNRYDGDHFGNIIWMEFAATTEKDYEWYFNNGTKSDGNVFAKLNYQLSPNFNLYADMQYRRIDYKMSGIDDDLKDLTQKHSYNFFNPKMGMYFEISPNQKGYFSFAVANREPTRANFKDATGDKKATPQPETLYDYELGYNLTTTNGMFRINLYYMDYVNQLVLTGEKSNVGYDIMTNVPDSYRMGIELTSGVKYRDFVKWDANVTFSRNKIKNFVEYSTHYGDDVEHIAKELGETDISYSPQIVASSILRINPIENLSINLISKYVGEQYFDNTSDENRKLDDYFVNNLRINYAIQPKYLKHIGFSLQINNLFDTEYISNAYGGNWYEYGEEKTWAYYFPQAGIHFLGGIVLKF